jgi:hypothetical protein
MAATRLATRSLIGVLARFSVGSGVSPSLPLFMPLKIRPSSSRVGAVPGDVSFQAWKMRSSAPSTSPCYVNELRARGHQGATIYLPHDGVNTNILTGKRLEDHLRDAGFSVTTIKNQGPGAASMRIEAARRLFSKVWFNEATTEPGRDALGYYHERRDERRDVQLGPEHDWSSHAADSFGLMAVSYEEPGVARNFNRRIEYPTYGIV